MRLRALALTSLLGASFALGDEPKPADKPATEAEITELRQELAAQRALLSNLIALEQQHVNALAELVKKGGGSLPVVADNTPVKPPPHPDNPPPHPDNTPKNPPPKPKGHGGTLSGKVAMTGTDTAWVYVEDVSEGGGGSASMEQKNKSFSPEVLVVQRGTTIDFPNGDPIFHNVFSVTPGSTFDLGGYPQGQKRSVTMNHAGQVNVFCNIHPQMIGYILVTPGPFFAQVGRDGSFSLKGVPAGHHKVVAWAPEAKPVSAEVDVADGDTASVNLSVAASSPKGHMRKDGTPYGSYNE